MPSTPDSRTSPYPMPARVDEPQQPGTVPPATSQPHAGADQVVGVPGDAAHTRTSATTHDVRRRDDPGGQQPGPPVDDRERDADRDQRQQETAAATPSPSRAADQAAGDRATRAPACQARPGQRGDRGVGLLGGSPVRRRLGPSVASGGRPPAPGSDAAREPRDQRRHSAPTSAQATAADQRAATERRGHRGGPTRARARLPGGAHRRQRRRRTPVNSSNCSAAWCTSRSSPPTSTRPRAAAARPAGSATGRRAPRTRPATSRAAGDQRRRPAPRPGSSRPRRRPSHGSPRRASPTSHARAAAGAGDRGDRLGRPLGRSAPGASTPRAPSSAERQADRGRGRAAAEDGARSTGPSHRSPSAATAPGHVGVVAEHGGRPRAPACWPPRPAAARSADLVRASGRAPSRLSGMVSDRPRQPRRARRGTPAARPRRPGRRRTPRRARRGVAARCSTGESECSIGSPSTAHLIGRPSGVASVMRRPSAGVGGLAVLLRARAL